LGGYGAWAAGPDVVRRDVAAKLERVHVQAPGRALAVIAAGRDFLLAHAVADEQDDVLRLGDVDGRLDVGGLVRPARLTDGDGRGARREPHRAERPDAQNAHSLPPLTVLMSAA
jgi:hypothetical protein